VPERSEANLNLRDNKNENCKETCLLFYVVVRPQNKLSAFPTVNNNNIMTNFLNDSKIPHTADHTKTPDHDKNLHGAGFPQIRTVKAVHDKEHALPAYKQDPRNLTGAGGFPSFTALK
jgi:hypothetical protein